MKNISDQLLEHTTRALESRSINQFAKDAGVQVATVSRWIKGERTITFETAAALAEHLGLELRQVRKRRKG